MNPELRRNLWLELTPHRLLAAPIVLGAIFLLVDQSAPAALASGLPPLAVAAALLFEVTVILWGLRSAADAVSREVLAHTWDAQRMSAISAWEMTWGKLVGAPAFQWYTGLLCLAVYVYATRSALPPELIAANVGLFVGCAILGHSLALFLSLLQSRDDSAEGPTKLGAKQWVALGVCGLPLAAAGFTGFNAADLPLRVGWFGDSIPFVTFALASLLAWGTWALVGAWALMRRELQQRNAPWLWFGFCVFSAAYVAGLSVTGGAELLPALSWARAFAVAAMLSYVASLADRKQGVVLRRTVAMGQRQDWSGVAAAFPRGPLALPIALVATVGVLAHSPPTSELTPIALWPLVVAAFLFLLRDVAFIFWMGFGSTRRSDAAAFLYLVLGYTLVPLLCTTLGASELFPLFFPTPGERTLVVIGAPALEAVVMLGACFLRVRTALETTPRERTSP